MYLIHASIVNHSFFLLKKQLNAQGQIYPIISKIYLNKRFWGGILIASPMIWSHFGTKGFYLIHRMKLFCKGVNMTKLSLLVSLMMASQLSLAQTKTTTKKKTVKSLAVASSTTSSAVADTNKSTSQTSSTNVSSSTTQPALTSPSDAASNSAATATAAQGTSTSTVAKDQAAKKKWSVSILGQGSWKATELNYIKNVEKQQVGGSVVTSLATSYKVEDKTSVSFALNLKSEINVLDDKTNLRSTKNTVVMPYVGLTQADMGSILGSDPLALSYRYYVPVSEGALKAQISGKLYFLTILNWTLDPNWSLLYYINPRMTLSRSIDDGQNYEIYQGFGPSYSFNDNVSVYYTAGLSSNVTNAKNKYQLASNAFANEVGLYVMAGKVLINPSISEEVNLKADIQKYGQEKQVGYALVVKAGF